MSIALLVYWVVSLPGVQPSLAQLGIGFGVYAIIGTILSYLAIPYLLRLNSRQGLHPRIAFGALFGIGTVAYMICSGFAPTTGQSILGMGPRATFLLLFGMLLWLPWILASVVYALNLRRIISLQRPVRID